MVVVYLNFGVHSPVLNDLLNRTDCYGGELYTVHSLYLTWRTNLLGNFGHIRKVAIMRGRNQCIRSTTVVPKLSVLFRQGGLC